MSARPHDVLPLSLSREKLRKHNPGAGKAEFLGLTLPVDVNMIFQVRMRDAENRVHKCVQQCCALSTVISLLSCLFFCVE